MEQFYTVSINGQRAVEAARMILGHHCTKIIKVGKNSGQMEIALDEDRVYNGYAQKWVDISYIDTREEADAIIDALPAMGFGGCEAELLRETTHGSYSDQAEIGDMFTIPASEEKEPESGTAFGEVQRVVRIADLNEIQPVTKKMMNEVIDGMDGDGKYLTVEKAGGIPVWVACDKRNGACWVEEFADLGPAVAWLHIELIKG